MNGFMNENNDCKKVDCPWTTCMVLQRIFKEEKTPFAFSTRDENYEGVFKIYSKNKMKIFVEKNGDVTLLWKSKKITNEQLCYHLKNIIENNASYLNGKYDISVIENEKNAYFLVLKKTLDYKEDSLAFASEIAYERVCFLADVNGIARLI